MWFPHYVVPSPTVAGLSPAVWPGAGAAGSGLPMRLGLVCGSQLWPLVPKPPALVCGPGPQSWYAAHSPGDLRSLPILQAKIFFSFWGLLKTGRMLYLVMLYVSIMAISGFVFILIKRSLRKK